MSKLRKIVSVLMAMVICLGMTTTVFADGTDNGSITINSSGTVSVEGKTFNAYRILDLTLTGTDVLTTDIDERGYVYTVPSALKSFYADYFNISEDVGDFSAQVRDEIAALSSNSDDLFAFAKAALTAAKEANMTAYSATGANATSVTISGLPLGYYLVEDNGGGTDTTISALMLDSTNETVTITLKADEPPLDKVIVLTEDDPDTSDVDEKTTGDTNNAAVGDVIPYELTSTVPDMTGYTKYYFVVTDTLSAGLTYNEDMAITITYTDEYNVEQTVTLKDSTDSSVTAADTCLYDLTVATDASTGETTLKIVFKNFIQYKNIAGADITITYSATLNENAVIGTSGNDNTAQLEYSSNPNYSDSGTGDEPDGSVPTGTTPDAKTTTYVTGIKLTKVNEDDDKLAGATFTLTGTAANKVQVTGEFYVADDNGTYWKLTDGTYTTTAPVITGGTDDTSSYYENTAQKYSKTTSTWVETTGSNAVTATAVTDANGILTFNGLAAGTYTITEIVAPDGYNLLTQPIQLTIDWTAPDTGLTTCTWSARYTIDGSEVTSSSTAADVDSTGIITLKVENLTGTILPSTGGMGTTLFYVIGGILVFGAAVLLITRKRMSRAE